jgi:NitT/TauT family transport system permease protein
MTFRGYRIPMMFSLLIWCVLWELLGRSGWVFIFPAFSGVLAALWEMVWTTQFHEAAWLSLKSFAIGMAYAVVAGIGLGVWMGRSESANRLLGMWVNIFASAPLSSLVPVIMLLFGLGQTTIIVTVAFFAVWIICLDTVAGVRHISPSLLEMASSFGASRWQLYTRVLFLAALPEILAGIRMGVIRAVKGVVIGQLLVSVVGFGRMFETYSRIFLMEEFWALTLVLFVFALGGAALIERLERRVEYYAGARH